jgi:hypothetical protein
MEQLGMGGQSVIHIYRPGVNSNASRYGFNLFHEYFHATRENSTVHRIERSIKFPTEPPPRTDSFYDARSEDAPGERQRRIARELGRRLAGTTNTAYAGSQPAPGGGIVAHSLIDGGPINSVVRNIWDPLGL